MEAVVLFMAAVVALITLFFIWTGYREKREFGL